MGANMRVTVSRPKYNRYSYFLTASYTCKNGAITPIHYEAWSEVARERGWKMLSRENTDTVDTEVWESPGETTQNNSIGGRP
jgi:hypothetical protein